MPYRKIKKLKDQVEYILKEKPETRNCDIKLTIEIWKEFYLDKLAHSKKDGEYYIKLDKLKEVPRQANIKRARAKFQNDRKEYLPTKWSVAKQRRIEEDEWRVAMGYPTKKTVGDETPSWTPESEKVQNKLI